MGMPKYDRLLYILNLLRSRRNLNAALIAAECGVTERSIYRDILALSEANIPIYYDRGYKLASGNFLPPLNFDIDEYQYFKMAVGSSPLNNSDKYRQLSKRVKAKVDSILSDSVRQQSKYAPSPTYISELASTDDPSSIRFFGVIEKAIESNKVLKLQYESIDSGLTSREVEPYFIIFRGRGFYFVAYCRWRQEFRTFRLGRVRKVKQTDDYFAPDQSIRPSTYFEGSWEVFSGEPIEVVVRLTGKAARVVATGKHHTREEMTRIDKEKIEYRVVTSGLVEIKKWILGFGSEAEVLKPAALRKELLELASALEKVYRT